MSLSEKANPFSLTPDTSCIFQTDELARQYSELQQAVISRTGFFLVTGDVGVGKTLLTLFQRTNHLGGKTALRKVWCALHVEQYWKFI